MKAYTPDRNDIIWLDFEPTKGKEIGITEVPVTNLDHPSVVVAANFVQTLSWRERKAKLIAEAGDGVMDEVLSRLLPLIGAERLFQD